MPENLRQKQKTETRKLIIETSLKLFGENGILNTKTSDIAKAAKVSHGTIFSHFATQEQLIICVIEEFGTRISKKLDELASNNESLPVLLKAHLDCLIEFEPFYTRLIIERRLLPDCVRDTYIMIQSAISFHIGIAAKIEEQKGYLKTMPIDFLFNTWLGLIHYYLTNSDLFTENKSLLRAYQEKLINNYINLIKI